MQSEARSYEHKARILVILESHPDITRLFRVAKRKAMQNGLDWEVVLIETPHLYRRLRNIDHETMIGALTLAEQMGALITRWRAKTIVDGVCEITEEYKKRAIRIDALVVAHRERTWPRIGSTLEDRISQDLGQQTSIIAVPVGIESHWRNQWAQILKPNLRDILIALFTVFMTVCFIETAYYIIPEAFGPHDRNKSIIFVLASALCAARYGMLAGIVAALGSYLALNMIYVTDSYDKLLEDVAYIVNMLLFLSAGVILAFLGSQNYGQRLRLAKRADLFHSLLKIHRLALNKSSATEAITALDSELQMLLGSDILFFLPTVMNEDMLEPAIAKDILLDEPARKALEICWQECKTTGVGAPYCPENCEWRFEPLTTPHDEIGVLAVRVTNQMVLDADFGRLLSGIADQVALILERLQLGQMAEANKIQAEREKLRAMLLSSVSHDLKTPLASIIGSLSVYRSMADKLPVEKQQVLIDTALDEAQRLDSFISNILDITRIESGQISVREEWVDPNVLISEVRRRLRERLRRHTINIEPPEKSMEVAMDLVMTAQVIQNLLDNAAKYTTPGSPIELSWNADETGFTLSVRDHGAGIPAGQLEKIFDKYARINRQDHQVAGTGLGLAIARAIMRAQGGTVTAENHPQGGAVFTIMLPKTRPIEEQKAAS